MNTHPVRDAILSRADPDERAGWVMVASGRARMRWLRGLAWAPMVVLLAAGMAKLADLSFVLDSLSTWRVAPAGAKPLIVLLIAASEAAAGLAFVMDVQRRRALAIGVGLLLTVTAGYTAEYYFFGRPRCSCFGAISAYYDGLSTAPRVLIGNVLLIACGLSGIRSGDFS